MMQYKGYPNSAVHDLVEKGEPEGMEDADGQDLAAAVLELAGIKYDYPKLDSQGRLSKGSMQRLVNRYLTDRYGAPGDREDLDHGQLSAHPLHPDIPEMDHHELAELLLDFVPVRYPYDDLTDSESGRLTKAGLAAVLVDLWCQQNLADHDHPQDRKYMIEHARGNW